MNCLEMAIWLGRTPETMWKDIGQDDKIDVHINFWHLENYKFVDIGVLYPQPFAEIDVTPVKIFINDPTITDKDVVNISHSFQTEITRNLIFNERTEGCSCRDVEAKCNLVKLTDKKFCVCWGYWEKTIEKLSCGTIITFTHINTQCTSCQGKRYLRIRICGNIVANSLNRVTTRDSKFEYHSSIYSSLAFRLNDVRSLSDDLFNKSGTLPKIGNVRFLAMLNSETHLERLSEPFKSMRLLEKGRWYSYLNSHKEASDLTLSEDVDTKYSYGGKDLALAYQWNRSDCDAFTLFIEGKITTIPFWKIPVLLTIVFVIGVLSSCISSCIGTHRDFSSLPPTEISLTTDACE